MKKIILSIAIFFLLIAESLGHVDHYKKYNYLDMNYLETITQLVTINMIC